MLCATSATHTDEVTTHGGICKAALFQNCPNAQSLCVRSSKLTAGEYLNREFTTTVENVNKKVRLETRGGQLLLLGGHFEKAAFRGGPHLLMEVEASLGL